jgi:peptide/nickel transport system substrate-binding protein
MQMIPAMRRNMKKLLATLSALLLGLTTAGAALAQSSYVYQTFGDVDTLDPEGAYDTSSGTVLENIYETLYGYAGASITEYEPRLATEYTVSEDNLTYTFKLREGVKFHSGNDFACKDVEYSLQRILVIQDASSGVWFQAEAFLGQDYGNANGYVTSKAEEAGADVAAEGFDPQTWEGADAAYAEYWQLIDNAITCVDDFTVQFTLPKVDPAFFVKLLYTNASIIDSAWAIENGDWDGTEATYREWVGKEPREGFLHNNASGTGAYRLISWENGVVVAEAFADYWDGAPAIQTVQIQNVDSEDSAPRILALQNGDADRITLGSDSDWATLESQVRGLPGVTIHEGDDQASLSVGAMHFNQNVVVEDNAANVGSGQLDGAGIPADFFSDINVRKGFAYSFDPQEHIEAVFLGQGTPLTMALPPSFLGYDPNVPTYSYDPEKAEEAFRAAWDGQLWETGFEMTITHNTGNTSRKTVAEILKANIEDLNPKFKINVRDIAWPDFLDDGENRRLPLRLVGWAPDYADPDNFMYTFYASDGYYGSKMSFSDPEMDQWLNDARATTDSEERNLIYKSIASRAYEVLPLLTYPTSNVFMVTSDKIQGVYYNPMLSHYYLWKDISKN